MNKSYLFLTILFILIQGLFAFFEMASVSFNKVRLQYYVSQGTRRAVWLNYLLQRPSRLFGTTLIGITTSLVIGSECARRFYESIQLDPDWAPLTQVLLVVIFGELAPMFAARRHPEQSAMLCVPLMYFIARILTPITMAFDAFSRLIHRTMGNEKEVALFLSRDEVRMAFEERRSGEDELDAAAGQIFQLKNLTAGLLMTPLSQVQMVPTSATIAEMRHLISVQYSPLIPIYHRNPQNVVAIAYLRDLLCAEDGKKVIEVARSPWFVTGDTLVLQLLQQFRRNNQSVAVILDPQGQACGLLTLDQILAKIFGEETHLSIQEEELPNYIERTLSGEMKIAEFNLQFDSDLSQKEGTTLSDLIVAKLGHLPVKDESVQIDDFEFTVTEPTLRGARTLTVRTIHD